MLKEIKAPDFDPKDFLTNYWQKQPLVIRSFVGPNWDPISPNELAGLACEDFVESRLVIEEKQDKGASIWQLKHGPFNEQDFEAINSPFWSLLVQSVDHWNEGVSSLLSQFDFLPAHILDDVMVSFAPAGASVGAHFDYYDVFLVQGLGSRRWSLGQFCDENSAVLDNTELSILEKMDTQTEITLNPGDVLYIPPQIAHHGIALEDCLTYSIGFRTPSLSQAMIALSDDVTDHLHESQRLNLPNPPEDSPTQLSIAQLESIRDQMLTSLLGPETLLDWYGRFSTEAKNEHSVQKPDPELSAETFKAQLSNTTLQKNEGSRFLYFAEGSLSLFVDGDHYPLASTAESWVKELCEQRKASVSDSQNLSDEQLEVLCELYNKGSLYFA